MATHRTSDIMIRTWSSDSGRARRRRRTTTADRHSNRFCFLFRPCLCRCATCCLSLLLFLSASTSMGGSPEVSLSDDGRPANFARRCERKVSLSRLYAHVPSNVEAFCCVASRER